MVGSYSGASSVLRRSCVGGRRPQGEDAETNVEQPENEEEENMGSGDEALDDHAVDPADDSILDFENEEDLEDVDDIEEDDMIEEEEVDVEIDQSEDEDWDDEEEDDDQDVGY